MVDEQGSGEVPVGDEPRRERLLALALNQPGYLRRSDEAGDVELLVGVRDEDEATIQAAIRILLLDERESVEVAAATALGSVSARSSVIDALADVLHNCTSEQVRITALTSLTNLGAVGQLATALEQTDRPAVRQAAVKQYGRLYAEPATRELARMVLTRLATERDPTVARLAAGELALHRSSARSEIE